MLTMDDKGGRGLSQKIMIADKGRGESETPQNWLVWYVNICVTLRWDPWYLPATNQTDCLKLTSIEKVKDAEQCILSQTRPINHLQHFEMDLYYVMYFVKYLAKSFLMVEVGRCFGKANAGDTVSFFLSHFLPRRVGETWTQKLLFLDASLKSVLVTD